MGWGKQLATPSTIDDKQWRSLQDRAAKANPARADISTREGSRAAKAGAEQYRKRGQS